MVKHASVNEIAFSGEYTLNNEAVKHNLPNKFSVVRIALSELLEMRQT